MPRGGGARNRAMPMNKNDATNMMRSRAMPVAAAKGAPMMKKKMSKAAPTSEKSLGVSASVATFGSAPMKMMEMEEDCMMMNVESSMMPQRQSA